MTVFNILIGITNLVAFIFLIFPSSLESVKKMDQYKLVVLCVFIACLIYWVYFLVISLIQHRNPLKVLMNFKEHVRVIKDPDAGKCYLVDGNTCLHIPDPPTFDYLGSYLGFSWADLETMTTADIRHKFTIGKALPSIQLHFPKKE